MTPSPSCSPTSRPGTRASRRASWTAASCGRFVNVYLNDEDVRFLDGITTKLSDGDNVTILPAVAGGMR